MKKILIILIVLAAAGCGPKGEEEQKAAVKPPQSIPSEELISVQQEEPKEKEISYVLIEGGYSGIGEIFKENTPKEKIDELFLLKKERQELKEEISQDTLKKLAKLGKELIALNLIWYFVIEQDAETKEYRFKDGIILQTHIDTDKNKFFGVDKNIKLKNPHFDSKTGFFSFSFERGPRTYQFKGNISHPNDEGEKSIKVSLSGDIEVLEKTKVLQRGMFTGSHVEPKVK